MPPARPAIADTALQRPDWTAEQTRDPRLLWLDKNENTDPQLGLVTASVLANIDPRSVAVYPDSVPLYSALADHVGVSSRGLMLAQGSDGIIGSVFRAFVGPGDRVLHTQPTYAMYSVYSRISGADVTTIGYRTTDEGPVLDPDEVIDALRKTRPKLLCLPNPDSPTGSVIEPQRLRTIVAAALDVGTLVLIDEAYFPFYPLSTVSWIEELPNLIVARTFSKAWGLTGLRLGYGVGAPETMALLHKVRPNYEVNMVAIAVAVHMIREHETAMVDSVARLNAGRDHFLAAMASLGLRTLPTHGCFALVAFDQWAAAVHEELRTLALYRPTFDDPCLKGFSRFSATTKELFQPVIDGIQRIVRPNG